MTSRITPHMRIPLTGEEPRLPTMERCEYDRPHKEHQWWVNHNAGQVGNYRQCQGILSKGSRNWTKQELAEFELWMLGDNYSLSGEHHLHFLNQRGYWEWVLRSGGGRLCGTPRCHPVTIKEEDR